MVAFANPGDALEWCLMVQEVMLEVGMDAARCGVCLPRTWTQPSHRPPLRPPLRRVAQVPWSKAQLTLPGAQVEGGTPEEPAFNGPRVKMGLYHGVPTKIVPHTTTGRADFFGPLVNRAARTCHAAAAGGQVRPHLHASRPPRGLPPHQSLCTAIPMSATARVPLRWWRRSSWCGAC